MNVKRYDVYLPLPKFYEVRGHFSYRFVHPLGEIEGRHPTISSEETKMIA